VVASNWEPWHGQSNFLPAGATVQPWWVQIALKPTTVPAVGCDRTIGLPSSFAAIEPPTGIADSFATAVPDVAELELALELEPALELELDAAAAAGVVVPAWAVAAGLLDELQPASNAPAPRAVRLPVASTVRRLTVARDPAVAA
jgi:hypothetical protein